MKKLLTALITLALVLLCAAAMAEIDIDLSFPDPAFNQYIREYFDKDRDGLINNAELAVIEAKTEIRRYESRMKNMKGIELFKNLEELETTRGDLEELDVSKNTKLRKLVIDHNYKLKKLTLGNHERLDELDLTTNYMTTLDLSGVEAIGWLGCDYNKLASLDLSGTKVEVLSCSNNGMTSLKLGKQDGLRHLDCIDNNLRSVDISQCSELDYMTRREPDGEDDKYIGWGYPSYNSSGLFIDQKTALITSMGEVNTQITKMTVDKAEVTLDRTPDKKNPTLALKPVVTPKNARTAMLKWTSSDPKVVKVDAKTGVITGLKAGTATITCTAPNSSGIKATCKVKVVDKLVLEISLNKQGEVVLTRTAKKLNPTLKLKAKVLPDTAANKEVTWSSSKPKVVQVDKKTGKLTALKPGTAVITCKATDGTGVKAAIKVTVKDTLVNSITLNKKKASLKVGKTLQLKIKKIKPADAVNQEVKWKSSDKKIATVDKDGKITAKKPGTCEITCTAKDGSKVYVKCKVTVKK